MPTHHARKVTKGVSPWEICVQAYTEFSVCIHIYLYGNGRNRLLVSVRLII